MSSTRCVSIARLVEGFKCRRKLVLDLSYPLCIPITDLPLLSGIKLLAFRSDGVVRRRGE